VLKQQVNKRLLLPAVRGSPTTMALLALGGAFTSIELKDCRS
jgi:hypothetical protein